MSKVIGMSVSASSEIVTVDEYSVLSNIPILDDLYSNLKPILEDNILDTSTLNINMTRVSGYDYNVYATYPNSSVTLLTTEYTNPFNNIIFTMFDDYNTLPNTFSINVNTETAINHEKSDLLTTTHLKTLPIVEPSILDDTIPTTTDVDGNVYMNTDVQSELWKVKNPTNTDRLVLDYSETGLFTKVGEFDATEKFANNGYTPLFINKGHIYCIERDTTTNTDTLLRLDVSNGSVDSSFRITEIPLDTYIFAYENYFSLIVPMYDSDVSYTAPAVFISYDPVISKVEFATRNVVIITADVKYDYYSTLILNRSVSYIVISVNNITQDELFGYMSFNDIDETVTEPDGTKTLSNIRYSSTTVETKVLLLSDDLSTTYYHPSEAVATNSSVGLYSYNTLNAISVLGASAGTIISPISGSIGGLVSSSYLYTNYYMGLYNQMKPTLTTSNIPVNLGNNISTSYTQYNLVRASKDIMGYYAFPLSSSYMEFSDDSSMATYQYPAYHEFISRTLGLMVGSYNEFLFDNTDTLIYNNYYTRPSLIGGGYFGHITHNGTCEIYKLADTNDLILGRKRPNVTFNEFTLPDDYYQYVPSELVVTPIINKLTSYTLESPLVVYGDALSNPISLSFTSNYPVSINGATNNITDTNDGNVLLDIPNTDISTSFSADVTTTFNDASVDMTTTVPLAIEYIPLVGLLPTISIDVHITDDRTDAIDLGSVVIPRADETFSTSISDTSLLRLKQLGKLTITNAYNSGTNAILSEDLSNVLIQYPSLYTGNLEQREYADELMYSLQSISLLYGSEVIRSSIISLNVFLTKSINIIPVIYFDFVGNHTSVIAYIDNDLEYPDYYIAPYGTARLDISLANDNSDLISSPLDIYKDDVLVLSSNGENCLIGTQYHNVLCDASHPLCLIVADGYNRYITDVVNGVIADNTIVKSMNYSTVGDIVSHSWIFTNYITGNSVTIAGLVVDTDTLDLSGLNTQALADAGAAQLTDGRYVVSITKRCTDDKGNTSIFYEDFMLYITP